MLTNPQKAEAIVAALEEASPQLLGSLAASNQLLPLIKERVAAHGLEYVKAMQARSREEELEVVESLMPMLTEFPVSPDQRPLAAKQRSLVNRQLRRYQGEEEKAFQRRARRSSSGNCASGSP